MEIIIDWQTVKTLEDFYSVFLPQVKAPDWHGHNLNALSDSIITGDINGVEPPYLIKSINSSKISEKLKEFQREFFEILSEAEEEGREISVQIS